MQCRLFCGWPVMRLATLILPKLIFWLLVIGIAMLVVPEPRWPREAGYAVIAVALVLIVVGVVRVLRARGRADQ